MSFLLRLVSQLPIPTQTRLAWQRTLLGRAYGKDISAARKLKDKDKVDSLERDHRFEIDLLDEEEDSHLTKNLLAKARRLRVPVPHRYNNDKTESEHWYESQYTGRWYLTTSGFSALRDEIRREEKARHEARAHWLVWLSGLTGVIGAVTGLVALLAHKLL
jgi:hypothetical protein